MLDATLPDTECIDTEVLDNRVEGALLEMSRLIDDALDASFSAAMLDGVSIAAVMLNAPSLTFSQWIEQIVCNR